MIDIHRKGNKITCYIPVQLDINIALDMIMDYQSYIWNKNKDMRTYSLLSIIHQHLYDTFSNDILYFITNKEKTMVKIGRTANIEQRFTQLKNKTPFDIDLHNYIPKAGNLEKYIHRLLSEHNVRFDIKFDGHTEWFMINKSVQKFMISESHDDIKKNLSCEKQ